MNKLKRLQKLLKTRRRKILAVTLSLLLLLTSLRLYSLLNPPPTKAAWFDDAYGYRQPFSFTHNADISTERRITFSLDTAELITAGVMQLDCDDTRFTNINGLVLRYELTGTCNNAATTYEVVFPSIINGTNPAYVYYGNPSAVSASDSTVSSVQDLTPSGGDPSITDRTSEELGPGPVAYWKSDEGYGSVVNDSTTNNNQASRPAGATGGAVKIDDAGDPGDMPDAGRQLVRTSNGTLYSVINDGSNVEVWKSIDGGSSWIQKDSGNTPAASASTDEIAVAVDGRNIIHISFRYSEGVGNVDVRYIQFNTATDLFIGTAEEAANQYDVKSISIAIDSNDKPHIVLSSSYASAAVVNYTNKVSTSWKSVVLLDQILTPTDGGLGKVDITISEDDVPEVAYINHDNNWLVAEVGNQNDASSFTPTQPDSSINDTANQRGVSIAVDSSGNTWIAYIDDVTGSYYATLVKHNDGDGWTTWQTPVTNSNIGYEPSIAINGGDIYVFYESQETGNEDDIVYDKYDGSSWSGETNLETGTYQDAKAKWSFFDNNHGSAQIDYLFSDNTDIYYNRLSFGEPASWQTENLCMAGKCLFYDGIDNVTTVPIADSIDFDRHLAAGFTFQAWVRVNSDGEANQGEIFDKGANTYLRITNEGSDGLADLEAKVDLATTDATKTITDGITLNQWHHVAVGYTDDGDDDISVYIDGQLAGTGDGSGAPASDTNNLLIGGDSSNNFHGFIDEFKIYKEERTADEIKTDFVKDTTLHGSAAVFGDDTSFLSEGLVGYWKMDEASADTCTGGTNDACDSSGNGNDGAWNGNATNAAGKFGNSVTFDGTGDYVEIANDSSLNFGTSSFSFAAWFKASGSAADRQIFRSAGGGGVHRWSVERISSDVIKFQLLTSGGGDDEQVVSTTNINDGNWHHVAASRDIEAGGVLSIYIDGVKEGIPTGTHTTSVTSATNPRIGANPDDSEYWIGEIDEVRIYNRAISPAEVADLYEWAPGPVGYWKLDEASDGTSAVTRNDSSGNGNNLTDNNTVTSTQGKFGKAGDFEVNSTEFLSISDASQSDLDLATYFTIAWWMNAEDTTANHSPLGKRGSASDYAYYVDTKDGGIRFEYSTDGSTFNDKRSANGIYSGGSWYHASIVSDGSNIRLYLNGTELTSGDFPVAFTGTINNSSGNFSIGSSGSNSQFYDGKIDDVRIYNYARTAEQIIEDMNAGHPAPGSPIGSPVGYWAFDEGYGDTAYDQTGNNNGNLAGGTTCPQAGVSACPTWSNSGKIGKTLDFDGGSAEDQDDYVDADSDSSIDNVFDDGGTFSAWVYTNSDGEGDSGRIGTKRTDATNGWEVITNWESSGAVRLAFNHGFNTQVGQWYSTNREITLNDWTHIAVTYDNSSTSNIPSLYVNGTSVVITEVTAPSGTRNDDNTYSLFIGNTNTGSRTFDGMIDEVKVYNFTLTADQIKVDYNQSMAAVWGTTSTDSSGVGTWSAQNEYCPPGQGSSCTAPIAEWKLDEKTGQSTYDTSENSNDGTLGSGGSSDSSDPIWKHAGECHVGACLDFDGSDDYVNAGSDSSLDVSTGTLTAWFKSDDTDVSIDQTIVGKNDNGINNGDFDLAVHNSGGGNPDKMQFYISDSSLQYYIYSDSAITFGEWTHVAVLFGTGGMKMYINGVEQNDTDANTVGMERAEANLIIGSIRSGSGESPFDGSIDNVKIYNYRLTPFQIAWDYNRVAPDGHWQLDECQGTVANDVGSGGNNGTIIIGASAPNTSAGTCSSGNSAHAWYNGRNGKRNASLDFDGTDDYVDLTSLTFNPSAQDFTVSAWIYAHSTGTEQQIFGQDSTGTIIDQAALDLLATGEIVAYRDAGEQVTIGNLPGTNQWVHVAFTYEGTTGKGYMNGVLGETDTTFPFDSLSNHWVIGAYTEETTCCHFDGLIDDVKYYNYTLTVQQVRDIYNEGTVRFGPETGSP